MINPIVYAEVSAGVERIEEQDEALPSAILEREAIPFEAAFLAGKALLAYRRRSWMKTSPLPENT